MITDEEYRWVGIAELLIFDFKIEYDIVVRYFPQIESALDAYLNDFEAEQQNYAAHQAQEDEQCPFN